MKELEDYSQELGLVFCMTLENLINSHRALRQECMTYRKDIANIRQETRDKAHKDWYDNQRTADCLSKEELCSMRLVDFARYISGEDNED